MISTLRRVAIIGGGLTGWCLSVQLADRGIASAIYDVDPRGRATSTKHQGWLHSGAYFAAVGDQALAEECRDGYRWLMQWAQRYQPSLVSSGVESYFLYVDKQSRDDTVARCQQWGITQPQAVGMQQLVSREGLLRGSLLRFALRVGDRMVDTTRLMGSVAEQACANGVEFRGVASLDALGLEWKGSHWDVSVPGESTHSFDALVLACGPSIPQLLAGVAPRCPLALEVTRVPMLVVCATLADSVLAVPGRKGAPQLVPFSGVYGMGVTICLHRFVVPVTYPDAQADAYVRRVFARTLAHWFTGIYGQVVAGSSVGAQLYFSRGLALQSPVADRGFIAESIGPRPGAPGSLFVVFPGRFTVAPVAAQECVVQLAAYLGATASGSGRIMPLPTHRPVMRAPEYCLAPSGHLLHDPVLGLRVVA